MTSETLRRAVAAVLVVGSAAGLALAKSSKSELQRDLGDTAIVGDWIYDDIDAAFVRAAREKKPVCVVFR